MTSVAFYGFPARGHTVPSLAIVRALAERGVEVDYHSTRPFQALVEGAGARFVGYPEICESLSRPADLTDHLLRVVEVTGEMLPGMLEDHRPELVFFDGSAIWGRILATCRGVPSVGSITTFALGRAMLRMLGGGEGGAPEAWSRCEPVIARLNRDFGASLEDPLDVMASAGDLKIVHTSRMFQPSGQYLDDSHVFVGPEIGRRPREGERVARSGERPLAYVSLGTIFNRDLGLLRRVGDALSTAGWQVVVALGGAEIADRGGWAPHVEVHAFVDQLDALSQADLMVTHGGMNSVSEALAHGVPMIVLPQAVDQHLVARRVAALGAGIMLEPAAATEAALREAIARITADRPAFEAAAARIARSFDDVTPLTSAIGRALDLVKAS